MAGTPTWQIELLYDGQCPFCRREVLWLKGRDRHGKLAVVDISEPSFDPTRYGLTIEEVTAVMHGVLPDGRIVRRIEAVRRAYEAVGLGWLMAPTRWPILRGMADRFYGVFARNRARLATLLGSRCESCRS